MPERIPAMRQAVAKCMPRCGCRMGVHNGSLSLSWGGGGGRAEGVSLSLSLTHAHTQSCLFLKKATGPSRAVLTGSHCPGSLRRRKASPRPSCLLVLNWRCCQGWRQRPPACPAKALPLSSAQLPKTGRHEIPPSPSVLLLSIPA